MQGYAQYPAAWALSEASEPVLYSEWIKAATANPYCVGVNWFQYRDEPVTGRGPGNGDYLVLGEDYAFGLVKVTDQPRWSVVSSMRATNFQAAHWR